MAPYDSNGRYSGYNYRGLYKPRTGQGMNHAQAILAAPAVYCIHGRIIHQARGRLTVQNVTEEHTRYRAFSLPGQFAPRSELAWERKGCESHTPSPLAATANMRSTVELLKLLTRYNETAFPVAYKGKNGQR